MAVVTVTRQDVKVTASTINTQNEPAIDQVGEAVTAGQALYQATDGTWKKANSLTDTKARVQRIALTSGATGDKIPMAIPGQLVVLGTSSLTEGTAYFADDGTDGGISVWSDIASNSYICHLGVAHDADTLAFNPAYHALQKS